MYTYVCVVCCVLVCPCVKGERRREGRGREESEVGHGHGAPWKAKQELTVGETVGTEPDGDSDMG